MSGFEKAYPCETGRDDEALGDLTASIALGPDDAESYRARDYADDRSSKRVSVIADYQNLGLDPGDEAAA